MIETSRRGNVPSRRQVIVDAEGAIIARTFDCSHDLGRVAHVSTLAESGELNRLRDYRETSQADADEEADDLVKWGGRSHFEIGQT